MEKNIETISEYFDVIGGVTFKLRLPSISAGELSIRLGGHPIYIYDTSTIVALKKFLNGIHDKALR